MRHVSMGIRAAVLLTLAALGVSAQAAEPKLALNQGDKIVVIGNTYAERMHLFGNFETLLYSRFPESDLVVRNLGWSADELTLRPRSLDFQDHGHKLTDHKPDVILACFGFNESFGGPEGLAKFEADLTEFVKETTSTAYNGKSPPKLVLVSPIAHEDLGVRTLPDGSANNKNIELYVGAMARIASANKTPFVDLFAASKKLLQAGGAKLTFNGVHLTREGDRRVSAALDEGLFGARPKAVKADLKALQREVEDKNRLFYLDYRAVNGYYIYGGRKAPFGVVNFPAEFAKLRNMISNRDERIWAIAQGKKVPAEADDSNTGEFVKIPTNYTGEIKLSSPEDSLKTMKLPAGYKIDLFASEVEFPNLQKPVQFAFDGKGRLWVVTMPSYPQYLPGDTLDDKVLIYEDTNGDGKADKETVFAGGLHLPTGIELGDGGAYVAAQPNLVFLADTDGDDKADHREIVLHGFDSADSHHSISAFTWGPDGALYFQEGTFHHTQIETPHGPQRVKDAAVFRYEPKTQKVDVFVSYGFANPWGHVFDRWGQNFVADASGGANYFGTAFSGQVDYPNKHGGMPQFLKMQWRPTSGCEFVASRHFPDDAQGNFLLDNCIGFQGVLNYKMREEGSGFFAEPVEPLLQSSDPNFRPVMLQFGPDGALYVCDWYNPLVGHMQHSIRDPNRDRTHGRIWRITHEGRPLCTPPKIAGASIPELLDVLTTYSDRDRYRARIELRSRDSVQTIAGVKKWVAGLDSSDPELEHARLEALWVHQQHDVVDPEFLEQMLKSSEPRARAAATRVLCYWRDRLPDALDLLEQQVNDEHPRVRLEAVRALSFFHEARAADIAVQSLAHPQDQYLEYALKETLNTLEGRSKAK